MKHALVTGANRGIGLEFVRQLKQKNYYVTACCRNPAEAEALSILADTVLPLDVTRDVDIVKLIEKIDAQPVDLLVNNAGTSGDNGVTAGNIDRDNFLYVFNVNCVGVVKLSDALLPNLKASEDKQILVVSSRMGSISDNDRGRSYAYRTSKAALNCAMRSFAIDVAPSGVKVMLMHPGWVKTDMGGENAAVEVHTSVSGMLQELERHFPKSHAEVLRRYDGGLIDW